MNNNFDMKGYLVTPEDFSRLLPFMEKTFQGKANFRKLTLKERYAKAIDLLKEIYEIILEHNLKLVYLINVKDSLKDEYGKEAWCIVSKAIKEFILKYKRELGLSYIEESKDNLKLEGTEDNVHVRYSYNKKALISLSLIKITSDDLNINNLQLVLLDNFVLLYQGIEKILDKKLVNKRHWDKKDIENAMWLITSLEREIINYMFIYTYTSATNHKFNYFELKGKNICN